MLELCYAIEEDVPWNADMEWRDEPSQVALTIIDK